MPRKARVVVPGYPHHITQRGNNRQPVFYNERDREAWLDRLFEYSGEYKLQVLAYCLMRNHVHLVLVPADERGLAKALGRLQADYARSFNFLHQRCGHTWQERFYSCPMDESHTLRAMAYIERNPVRAGITEDAGRYRWSSAAIHLAGEDPKGRLDLRLWNQWYTPERWGDVLRHGLDEELWRERFREATRRGLPWGSENFIARLENEYSKDLRMRPPGRPPRRSVASVEAVA